MNSPVNSREISSQIRQFRTFQQIGKPDIVTVVIVNNIMEIGNVIVCVIYAAVVFTLGNNLING